MGGNRLDDYWKHLETIGKPLVHCISVEHRDHQKEQGTLHLNTFKWTCDPPSLPLAVPSLNHRKHWEATGYHHVNAFKVESSDHPKVLETLHLNTFKWMLVPPSLAFLVPWLHNCKQLELWETQHFDASKSHPGIIPNNEKTFI